MRVVKHKSRMGVITTPHNRRYKIFGKPAERVEFTDNIAPEFILRDELREVKHVDRA
jgi:hypothetical protein